MIVDDDVYRDMQTEIHDLRGMIKIVQLQLENKSKNFTKSDILSYIVTETDQRRKRGICRLLTRRILRKMEKDGIVLDDNQVHLISLWLYNISVRNDNSIKSLIRDVEPYMDYLGDVQYIPDGEIVLK